MHKGAFFGLLSIWGVIGLAISCGDGTASQAQTSITLWRQMPTESIVFTSRTDSPHGELHLMGKQGVVSRLTNNSRHENSPALSPDGH